jgi:hypothetical protein
VFRSLLNLLTLVSLLLFVAVAALRIRARFADDSVTLVETRTGTYVARLGPRHVTVIRHLEATTDSMPIQVVLDVPHGLLGACFGALPAVWTGRWLRRHTEEPTDA